MIRSEYAANVALSSTPRTTVPAWMKPAPVRAVRTVKRSIIARILGL